LFFKVKQALAHFWIQFPVFLFLSLPGDISSCNCHDDIKIFRC
jgi:hypothetical protein